MSEFAVTHHEETISGYRLWRDGTVIRDEHGLPKLYATEAGARQAIEQLEQEDAMRAANV